MERQFEWPDRIEGAVSLTYDDGLSVHVTAVGPLLRQHGLLATFYPPVQSDLRVHPEHWAELAAAGHELGNHTVFHPCWQNRSQPYDWLDERYELGGYKAAQFRAELEVANLVLHLLDGQSDRSFGNTCCDTIFGEEQAMEPLLRDMFVAARGALTNRIANPAQNLNLFDIGCIDVAGWALEALKHVVGHARMSRGWAVLMIHGVGAGTHSMYLESDAHERFIGWLAAQETTWVAPVREIAGYIKGHAPTGLPPG